MRLEQLEYLAAVTRHGSLRRASEHLHVSQPALSEAISRLERELGVTLLERHRSGARISRQGLDLLPRMLGVLDAAEDVRTAAGRQARQDRHIRIGTVNAGTSSVLVPALRAIQMRTTVEVRNLQQSEIQTSLQEGALDLGLVNLLSGDDTPPDLERVVLHVGRPVVVLPAGHALTEHLEITTDDLRDEAFIGMRAGYLMYRFAHRIFGAAPPALWHSTDGAEMGKMMVAECMGLTLLPDYSVLGDPLERAGLITTRPIADDTTTVTMVLLHRRAARLTPAATDLIAAMSSAQGSEPVAS